MKHNQNDHDQVEKDVQQVESLFGTLRQALSQGKTISVQRESDTDSKTFKFIVTEATEAQKPPARRKRQRRAQKPKLRFRNLGLRNPSSKRPNHVNNQRVFHEEDEKGGEFVINFTLENEGSSDSRRRHMEREAKNIIKNLLTEFKKFPRSITAEAMHKIVSCKNLTIEQIEIVQDPTRREGEFEELLKKIEYQFEQTFGEKMMMFEDSKKERKRGFHFNRVMLSTLVSRPELCKLFKFWLQQYAHYYVACVSKIMESAKAQHRAAVDTLIKALRQTNPKPRIPPFKHNVKADDFMEPVWSNFIKFPKGAPSKLSIQESPLNFEKSRSEGQIHSIVNDILGVEDYSYNMFH